MVRRLNFGGERDSVRGPVMEEGVGQRAADALLEEDEQGGDFDALGGEPVRVAPTLALQERVAAHVADVIREWGDGLPGRGDRKGFERGGVQLGGAPASELRSAMQQGL